MKDDKKLRRLYQKVIEGTASPDEQALVARWLDQLDTDEGMDKQAAEEWKARSIAELRKAIKPPIPIQSRTRKFVWAASAAAVLLFAIATLIIRFYSQQPIGVEAGSQVLVYTEHSTIAGQRKLLKLADGSRVWLGNVSTIRYPKDFQPDKREVFLEGQAFFEVSPDSIRPFLVHTDGLDVRVLGTSFNVKSYSNEGVQTVSVATGKVSVKPTNDRQEWMLEKGQQVSYHSATKKGVMQETDLSEALNWKDGELIFRDMPLEEIAMQLERWYGVTITIASPSVNNRQLSLSVKDEPLQAVLKMLSLAGDFHFEIRGNHVKIWK
ncbi:FecR family protein [Parapedobacter koreensis]|uniref:FecR family protein n=2 Tax=Parapedobacter koreensis TaxID=332977 RepID=A0A1H7FR36_9SPHI|nr:FecR family protein [Parapedobacter koreensis]